MTEVLNIIPNDPPEITNLVDVFTLDEDEGTLEYSFEATDPDGDVLVFELGLYDETPLGSAAITEDGVFSFTPCPNCYGSFTLQIIGKNIHFILSQLDNIIPAVPKRNFLGLS